MAIKLCTIRDRILYITSDFNLISIYRNAFVGSMYYHASALLGIPAGNLSLSVGLGTETAAATSLEVIALSPFG